MKVRLPSFRFVVWSLMKLAIPWACQLTETGTRGAIDASRQLAIHIGVNGFQGLRLWGVV